MTYLSDAARATLIIIDLQEKLMPVISDDLQVLERAAKLAQAARLLGIPVIGTAQQPSRLGPMVAPIRALLDRTIEKSSFDACAQAEFMDALTSDRDELILLGCEAHICVLQTALGLLHRHRRVKMVSDAVGSRRSSDKIAAVERARAAGVEIVTSEMLMFEWMRDSNHPQFRDILKLIK